MTEVSSRWIGRGVYSLREAARLLQLDPEKVARWTLGKTTAGRHWQPAIVAKVDQLDDRPTLAFADLVELLFIKGFLAKGLSLQYIRRAAEDAAQLLSTDHPFAVQRFQTDGRKIFATVVDPSDERTHELLSGQLIIERVLKRYLEELDYDLGTGQATKWWPQGKRGRVFLDPQVSFGAPLTLSGVPTETLYLAFKANGRSQKRVADWYEVDVKDVRAAVKYEQQFERPKLAA